MWKSGALAPRQRFVSGYGFSRAVGKGFWEGHDFSRAEKRRIELAALAAELQEPVMEGIDRLVSESLARHGFDRPLDYRRLQWSRWFRCDSPHSLLCVPSKPGVFAIAEEIMDAGNTSHVGTAALGCPVERSSALEATRRMLAVTQFLEADDMAFVLDRMLSRPNPMRANLESGRYFVRFVPIEDESQRRSVACALNQWMLSTADKATGIGSHFASSLELTPTTEHVPQANNAQGSLFSGDVHVAAAASAVPQGHASGTPPFPSGF